MSMNKIKDTRRRWTFEETHAFLKCYINRRDEFQHIKKKKIAYANVLKDMIEQGFLDTTLKITALEAKMRTLLQAYRNAINSNSKFPFIEEMDEIFGRELKTSIQGSNQEKGESDNFVSPSPTLSTFDIDSFSSHSESSLSSLSTFDIDAIYNKPNSLAEYSRKSRKKSPKEMYYEKKLELKKKFYEDIKEMIAKKLNSL